MANAIVMPKAGISVESCIIGKWRVKVGDQIEVGDIIFDFETDKASFECEATHSGTLLAILYETGDEVVCLQPVCVVGEEDEDISSFVVQKKNPASSSNKAPETLKRKASVSTTNEQQDPRSVSPRATTLAKRMKVNLADIAASGPEGRIIARDVVAYSLKTKDGLLIGGRGATDSLITEVNYVEELPSQIRRTIATVMHKSLSEMAQLTHHHSCDVTNIVNLRKTYKASSDETLKQISLNDLLMFSVIKILQKHEYFNATFADGVIRKYQNVNLGIAVDTPRGLLVPTIFAAESLSIEELSQQASSLAETARSGAINPDLLHGGTFTVSNLGLYGVEMFTPIINPPQTAILGICSIQTRFKETEEGLKPYPAMGLSLSYDHRVIDGAQAARFMQDLVNYIESFDLS